MTFDTDITDPVTARRTLLALAGQAAARLRATGQVGRTVAVKVRFADFRTVHRSRTLGTATDVAQEVFATAWSLSGAFWSLSGALTPTEPVRVLGVRLEGLASAADHPRQPSLGGARARVAGCGGRGGRGGRPFRRVRGATGQPPAGAERRLKSVRSGFPSGRGPRRLVTGS